MESFKEMYRTFIKYSLSTKIPEYMYSGKPILFFGPESITVSKYIKENHVGLVANTWESLERSLIELKNDIHRKSLGENGKKLAIQNHSVEASRIIFENAIDKSLGR
jgi:hypothetical protein